MDYKVSVIVPVYKSEKYLVACIESLLEQTLKQLEIILIDDGSPDGCGEICDRFAERYENIIVVHLENGGPSRARNIGISYAHGEYIGFVDSDDYIDSDMFFTLYKEAYSHKVDIVMCEYYIDNEETHFKLEMEYRQEYKGQEEIKRGLLTQYFRRYHNGLYSVWNKLFDSNLIQNNKIEFDTDLIRAEDAWFVFDCLKVAKKIRFINKPLYHYRQVKTSTMHIVQKDRYERSKAFRTKLEKENTVLGIAIDYDEFYYEFLYESFLYCRAMIQQDNTSLVKNVLEDDFFRNACQYNKFLPIHLRMMCKLEIHRMQWGVRKMLQLWGKK